MRLDYQCSLRSVSEVSESLRAEMFKLLDSHFYNVDWQRFCLDLNSKDYVFLLHDSYGSKLVGFSTQKLLRAKSGENVVFSGDTIIDPSAWGSLEFSKAWGLWMLSLFEQDSSIPLYWLLISKGQRTYRYLSTFFIDFVPSLARSYNAYEHSLIEEVGRPLFGQGLVQSENGYLFVKPEANSQYLREHLLPAQDQATENISINFFQRVNPLYRQGSELVCLLNFSPENMRPFCRRMLGIPRLSMKAA